MLPATAEATEGDEELACPIPNPPIQEVEGDVEPPCPNELDQKLDQVPVEAVG